MGFLYETPSNRLASCCAGSSPVCVEFFLPHARVTLQLRPGRSFGSPSYASTTYPRVRRNAHRTASKRPRRSTTTWAWQARSWRWRDALGVLVLVARGARTGRG